jgi:hypothetical protein
MAVALDAVLLIAVIRDTNMGVVKESGRRSRYSRIVSLDKAQPS